MITINSGPKARPEFVALEATLVTPGGTYDISSDGDIGEESAGGLFGRIAWPRSRFRIGEGVVLEQQGFLPNDGAAVAFSWNLSGDQYPARLIVRPWFGACGPMSFRNQGFLAESENGDRLTWLPHVLGPRFFADTNGICRARVREINSPGTERLVSPGEFEFELSRRPSILIISKDHIRVSDASLNMGAFLAGLLQPNRQAAAEQPVIEFGTLKAA